MFLIIKINNNNKLKKIMIMENNINKLNQIIKKIIILWIKDKSLQ